MFSASSINTHLVNRSSKTRILTIQFILLFILSIWIFGFIQPMLGIIDNALVNYFLKRTYSIVCHQESHKLITHAGAEMLVCSRCAGIYIGSLLAGLSAMFFTFPGIKIKVLIISLIPLASDVLFYVFGLYDYSKLIAFSTGVLLGITLYLFLMYEMENLFSNKNWKK